MRYLWIAVPVVGVAIAAVWYLQGGETPTERTGTPQKERVVKTEEEWQKELTPEQYRVTRLKGTERAGSGKYARTKDDGIYNCVCCGQPLFDAKTKYESGTRSEEHTSELQS